MSKSSEMLSRIVPFAVVLFAPILAAAQQADDHAAGRGGPVVVELFLSQSCSACPPAAAHLAELASRPDVFALSWHVEYWDLMGGGRNGVWKDPYAHSAYSERQRGYNERLIGRRKVFTPQAVVGGAHSVVGSRRGQILELVAIRRTEASTAAAGDAPAIVVDGDRVRIAGGDEPRDVLLVRFMADSRTDVLAGANAGQTFVEANVVTQAAYLGRNLTGPAEFELPALGASPDLGCAVLLQGAAMGRIDAVARCDGR